MLQLWRAECARWRAQSEKEAGEVTVMVWQILLADLVQWVRKQIK